MNSAGSALLFIIWRSDYPIFAIDLGFCVVDHVRIVFHPADGKRLATMPTVNAK